MYIYHFHFVFIFSFFVFLCILELIAISISIFIGGFLLIAGYRSNVIYSPKSFFGGQASLGVKALLAIGSIIIIIIFDVLTKVLLAKFLITILTKVLLIIGSII